MRSNGLKGFVSLAIVLFLLVSCCVSVKAERKDVTDASGKISKTLSDNNPKPKDVLYTKPTDYAQLVSWYTTLEGKYPNYLEVIKTNSLYSTGTIPKSGGGSYDHYTVRLTNESLGLHKPECLFNGAPHGDETVGTISQYWFCDWLLRNAFDPQYASSMTGYLRWILDNREIYLVVSHNPDGFDQHRRYDANDYDLNRGMDFNGPGGGGPPDVMYTVNDKTLGELVDHHQFRTGVDYHGGARMLLYPWGCVYDSIYGTNPDTGQSWSNAPPDFYWFDTSYCRMRDYIGSYGGTFEVAPPPAILYSAYGTQLDWAYASNAPHEAGYVKYGPYPGAGIQWISPECYTTKNPPQSQFGGDSTMGLGIEIRRLILHMADIAQPYIQWQPNTVQNNSNVQGGASLQFDWFVNGSMVCDETYMQWGNNPDPIHNSQYTTTDHTDYQGMQHGGTGWDNANNGATSGKLWKETIVVPSTPGDYYFVAKAKVDQFYKDVLRPDVYGQDSYLRLIEERTKSGWSEDITGTDGTEHMGYHDWWYSPIIHVQVSGDSTPPTVQSVSPTNHSTGVPTNTVITVTFSEAMNRVVTNGSFSTNPSTTGTISWSGNMMSYTPSAALQPNTMYNVTVSKAAEDLAGNHLQTDYVWCFTTASAGDTIPPTVTGTVPNNGAINVAVTATISVSFSEAMDKVSVQNSFSIAPSVTGAFSWNLNTTTFTPTSPLATSTQYTVTVGTGSMDLAGNHLQSAYTFSFTTSSTADTTPPSVLSTDPPNQASNVPPNKKISVTFTEAVDQPSAEGAFSILPAATGTFEWAGNTMKFNTTSPLQTNTGYNVTISTAVMDLAGNHMSADYKFFFTTSSVIDTTPPTVIGTFPLDGLTGVSPFELITITFSEAMDTAATEDAIHISPQLDKQAITWAGNQTTIDPLSTPYKPGMKENTLYSVTIFADARDVAGNYMVQSYTFSFTTGAATIPTVMWTKPGDGDVNVSLDTTITVNFSKPMNLNSVSSAFSVSPSVTGTFSTPDHNRTVIFTPSEKLKEGTDYTVTVDKTAKDLAGNSLDAKKTFTFKTEGQAPPSGGNGSGNTGGAFGVFTSTPFLIGILLIVIIVVIVAAALIAMKKRKKQQPVQPQTAQYPDAGGQYQTWQPEQPQPMPQQYQPQFQQQSQPPVQQQYAPTQPSSPAPVQDDPQIGELNRMKEKGLISEQEYNYMKERYLKERDAS